MTAAPIWIVVLPVTESRRPDVIVRAAALYAAAEARLLPGSFAGAL